MKSNVLLSLLFDEIHEYLLNDNITVKIIIVIINRMKSDYKQ